MKLPLRQHRRRAGFSLIEVTIALGISALGITSILGMLPQGMGNLKKASDLAAETRISQYIISEVTQAQWQDKSGGDLLSYSYNGKRYYFDDMAQVLDARDPGPNVSYVAQAFISTQGVSIPGGKVDPYLRRLTVKMKNTTQRDFDFDSAEARQFHLQSAIVTRSGL